MYRCTCGAPGFDADGNPLSFPDSEALKAHRIKAHRFPCPSCGKKSKRPNSVYCNEKCFELAKVLKHPHHKVLREAIRHYLEFEAYVTNPDSADVQTVIDATHGNLTFKDVTINFFDLQDALKMLSPRKKEAVFHHVIMDDLQRDVEKTMGITTVTVGQYVEQAMLQLCKNYFDLQEMRNNPQKKKAKGEHNG